MKRNVDLNISELLAAKLKRFEHNEMFVELKEAYTTSSGLDRAEIQLEVQLKNADFIVTVKCTHKDNQTTSEVDCHSLRNNLILVKIAQEEVKKVVEECFLLFL